MLIVSWSGTACRYHDAQAPRWPNSPALFFAVAGVTPPVVAALVSTPPTPRSTSPGHPALQCLHVL